MKLLVGVLFVAFLAMPITAWITEGAINWDYNCYWDDYSPFASQNSLAGECGGICIATSGCKAFDWDPSKQVCFMYHSVVGILHQNGWICGYREFHNTLPATAHQLTQSKLFYQLHSF